jgi:predicted transcriptional regulator
LSDVDSKYNSAEATAHIVAAYVGANHIAPSDVPILIKTVRGSLDSLTETVEAAPEPQAPAVSLRRLVTPDTVFCAECGAGFKSLKRHLGTEHDLTPEAYRNKWGLKKDVPMVAPNYAAKRSELAKSIGLGRKPEPPPPPPKAAKAKPAPAAESTPKPTAKRTAKATAKAKLAEPDMGDLVDGADRPGPMFE